jgi:alpha-galactosidase
MAMNTWACNQYGGVQTIGLCHGVQHGHQQIAECIERWARQEGLIADDERVTRDDVDIVCAGINHQTWYIKVQWRGMDMIPKMLELFENHPVYARQEKVRIDMIRRTGYYSTESNGHLSEYVPWYRKRSTDSGWIDLSGGSTAKRVAICGFAQNRNWFETDFPNWMKELLVIAPENRSTEHGSSITRPRPDAPIAVTSTSSTRGI